MLEDQTLDLAKIMRRNPAVPSQRDVLEPKLALLTRSADVHMRRLIRFIGIEVKTVRPYTEDSWHRKVLFPMKATDRSLLCKSTEPQLRLQ